MNVLVAPSADRYHRLRWVTLVATSLALFMALLDNMIVVTALPSIARDFNASREQQQWIINAYILVFGMLLVSFGKLGDQFGRRRLFILGVMLFVGGSVLCSAAPNAGTLITFRVLQGLGPAFIFPLTLAIISETFEAKERAVAIAVWGTLAGVSLALGPVAGGFLTDHVSWRAVFWVNAPIGVLVIGLTLWATKESRDFGQSKAIDWVGNILIALALFSLLFALTKTDSPTWDWGTSRNVGMLSLSAVLALAFVANEWRMESHGGEPLVSSLLFKNPTYLAANIAAVAISAGMFAVVIYNVLYLQNGLGYSALAAGTRMLAFAGAIILTSPLSAALSERVGPRWPLTLGFGLIAAGMLILARRVSGGEDFTHYWWALSVVGLGAGLIFPAIGTAVIGTFSPDKTGLVSGLNDMSREIGGALGIAVAGALFGPAFKSDLGASLSSSSFSPDQVHSIAASAGRGAGPPPGLPPDVVALLQAPIRHAYSAGLVDILHVSAFVLVAGAVASFALARRHHMWNAASEAASHDEEESVATGLALVQDEEA